MQWDTWGRWQVVLRLRPTKTITLDCHAFTIVINTMYGIKYLTMATNWRWMTAALPLKHHSVWCNVLYALLPWMKLMYVVYWLYYHACAQSPIKLTYIQLPIANFVDNLVNPVYACREFPTKLTPRGWPCCIVRILKECALRSFSGPHTKSWKHTKSLWYSCHELCSSLLTETQWTYRNLTGQETKLGHIF